MKLGVDRTRLPGRRCLTRGRGAHQEARRKIAQRPPRSHARGPVQTAVLLRSKVRRTRRSGHRRLQRRLGRRQVTPQAAEKELICFVTLNRLASTYCRCTPPLADFSRASPLRSFEQPAIRRFSALAGEISESVKESISDRNQRDISPQRRRVRRARKGEWTTFSRRTPETSAMVFS